MSEVFPITADPRYRISTAVGGELSFSIPFPFQHDLDIAIVKIGADGLPVTLVSPADYTMTGASDPNGGAVNLSVAAIAGDKYIRMGAAILTRVTSVLRGARFSSKAIDDDIDRFTIIAQELARDQARALKTPIGNGGFDVAVGTEGQLLAFDKHGNLSPVSGLGVEVKGAWASGETYTKNDIVEYGGSLWLSRDIGNIGNVPAPSEDWVVFLPGSSVADGAVTSAKLSFKTIVAVSSKAELASVSVLAFNMANLLPGDIFELKEYSDFSDLVTLDVLQGVAIRSTDDVSKVWVRRDLSAVYPEWFGAAAGMLIDQSGIFESCFKVANHLDALVKLAGVTYRFDTAKIFNFPIKITGVPGKTTIDASNMASGEYVWIFAGSYGSAYPVVAGGASGGTQVTVSALNSTNFEAGKYCLIRSNDVFDASDTNSKIGELVPVSFVNEVSGVMTMKVAFYDSYVSTPVVEAVDMLLGVHLSNLIFVGGAAGVDENNYKAGVSLALCDGARIENCHFSRFDYACVEITDCADVIVQNCNFKNARTTGTGYGVIFVDATAHSAALHNYFSDVRHSMTTGNTNARGGIPRHIDMGDNKVVFSAPTIGGSPSPGDAIDTHAAAEYVRIFNNVVIGASGSGINSECPSVSIYNNVLTNCAQTGIEVRNESDRKANITISNNVINNPTGRGIYYYPGTRGTLVADESVRVLGNLVRNAGGAGIQMGLSASRILESCMLVDNEVFNPGNYGVLVQRTDNLNCVGNTIHGVASHVSFYGYDIDSFSISGGIITQPPSSAKTIIYISASASGASSQGLIIGVRMGARSGSMTGKAVLLGPNTTHTRVAQCNGRGAGAFDIGAGSGNQSGGNVT